MLGSGTWTSNVAILSRWIDVHNPATNTVVTKVPQSTQEVTLSSPDHDHTQVMTIKLILPQQEMERAVESSKSAFRTWSKTTPLARQQVDIYDV